MATSSESLKSDLVRISWVFGFFAVLYVVFFSPVLFSDRMLAPVGDALNYYLPNFCSGAALWEPLLQSGYPMAADPQAMSWYPISLLLSKHPACGICSFFQLTYWPVFFVRLRLFPDSIKPCGFDCGHHLWHERIHDRPSGPRHHHPRGRVDTPDHLVH